MLVWLQLCRTWELQAPYTKAKITTPAFFIAGSKDIVWHVPGNREYVEGGGLKFFVPNLRSYVVLDSGHFIQQEKHEQVNELLINFLRNELPSESKL
jgi:pimeloyl-ACP methyl ester carboxylesterase